MDQEDLFGQQVREVFEDVRALVAGLELQITEAQEGELCIGDAPAQSLRKGPSYIHVGVLGGVPWNEADTSCCPSVRSTSPLWVLRRNGCPCDPPAVELMSHDEMAAAHREVYYRPGSGLSTIIRARREVVLTEVSCGSRGRVKGRDGSQPRHRSPTDRWPPLRLTRGLASSGEGAGCSPSVGGSGSP